MPPDVHWPAAAGGIHRHVPAASWYTPAMCAMAYILQMLPRAMPGAANWRESAVCSNSNAAGHGAEKTHGFCATITPLATVA